MQDHADMAIETARKALEAAKEFTPKRKAAAHAAALQIAQVELLMALLIEIRELRGDINKGFAEN